MELGREKQVQNTQGWQSAEDKDTRGRLGNGILSFLRMVQ